MPNISRGNVAVQWFATRHERVKPKAPPKAKAATMQGRGPAWTDAEDALVRKCYYSSGPVALAAELGRTPKAVRKRAENLDVLIPKSLRVSA